MSDNDLKLVSGQMKAVDEKLNRLLSTTASTHTNQVNLGETLNAHIKRDEEQQDKLWKAFTDEKDNRMKQDNEHDKALVGLDSRLGFVEKRNGNGNGKSARPNGTIPGKTVAAVLIAALTVAGGAVALATKALGLM